MNASATITIEDREDVLTLPMNALQEKGDRTFVYTEKDDDGNLFGETEVTTGLSDGSTVEITDGLEEGTTVYYLRSESSSSGSSYSGGSGSSVVDYATQFVGNPYVWGGTSLTNGADAGYERRRHGWRRYAADGRKRRW